MGKRLNILYIHRTRGIGVEQVHINGFVDSWRDMGHQVYVFSPLGHDDKENGFNHNDSAPGLKESALKLISKHVPEFMFEIMEIIYSISRRRNIAKYYNDKKIDFIYERYSYFSDFGLRFAKKLRVPFILEINYTSNVPLVRKRSTLLLGKCRTIEKMLFSEADVLVAVSNYLKDSLVKDYNVLQEKVLVLPNAADTALFDNREKSYELKEQLKLSSGPTIGFVGGFYPWHGLSLLVEAFSIVLQKIKECNLVLIGDGPEKANIEKQVLELGIGKNVVFTGIIRHDYLPGYISCFDIAVMPDSNDYGSPMKIFEYMAMGKPVVAPDYGPLLDVVKHGVNGLVFKRKSMEGVVECLLKLLGDSNLRQTIGTNARKCIEENHNWKKNAESVLNEVQKHFNS